MKRFSSRVLLAAATLACSSGRAQTAIPAVHVDDGPNLLSSDSSPPEGLEAKLAAFERENGSRILLQLHVDSPPPEQDKVPGAYMHGLAKSLGVAQRGVLVVYFADEDDWRIWFGDETVPEFVGRKGTARELTENGAIHEAKEAFLTSSAAKAKVELAARNDAPGAEQREITARRIRTYAAAIIEGLIERLQKK